MLFELNIKEYATFANADGDDMTKASHGLQLRSLWLIPTAAVSSNTHSDIAKAMAVPEMETALQVSHGLQLQSLWGFPTAAVS